jgi:hypothetical protein
MDLLDKDSVDIQITYSPGSDCCKYQTTNGEIFTSYLIAVERQKILNESINTIEELESDTPYKKSNPINIPKSNNGFITYDVYDHMRHSASKRYLKTI